MTVTTPPRPTLHEPHWADALDRQPHRMIGGTTRRRVLGVGAGVAALAGLSACGDDATSTGTGSSASGRSVRHKYGTTKVPDRPKRVVTLGYTDQEPVLALGTRPVGIVEFFGDGLDGSWPWETPLWHGTKPQLVGERDTYRFEKIAALRPDLIIGMYSGMTKSDYAKLSRLAPTVAQPPGHADFAAPWTVMTRMAGEALGRSEQADRLISDVRASFAAARRNNPKWAGKTVAVAEPTRGGQWAVFGAKDPKVQFMTELGFTVAPAVRDYNPGGDVKQLSLERLHLLDVDRLILLIDSGDQTKSEIERSALFRKLAVSRGGRTTFTPFSKAPAIGAALSYNSVISIPHGIKHMVSTLQD